MGGATLTTLAGGDAGPAVAAAPLDARCFIAMDPTASSPMTTSPPIALSATTAPVDDLRGAASVTAGDVVAAMGDPGANGTCPPETAMGREPEAP